MIGIFSFDNLKIYGDTKKICYLIVYTGIIQKLNPNNVIYRNEKVSEIDFDYYYAFPLYLGNCKDGQIPIPEYN